MRKEHQNQAEADDAEPCVNYEHLSEDGQSIESTSIRLNEDATEPSVDYKCACKTFCGCLSLRTGCILIAVLYTLYALIYLGFLLTFLILLSLIRTSDAFTLASGLNYAILEFLFTLFTLVFLCLGLSKLDYRKILVSKSIMVLYLMLNINIAIRIFFFGVLEIGMIHFCIFLLPVPAFICVLHSYEAELWKLHKKSARISKLKR